MTSFNSFIKDRWSSDNSSASSYNSLFICIFLVFAILIIYWQVINFDFVNYDDPEYITNNNIVQKGITIEGIAWSFTSFGYASNWHPMTWISHMLDVQLFGLNPGMHHLTNVIFHIINTLLLFLVLERMTGALWRSAVVAAFFALHPLHVESVAWVAERKDVLSTFFWILTIMAYVWYVQKCNFWRYLLVVLLYILGLLSKPMLVTLPFVLLLLDYWPLKRFDPIQKEDIVKNTKFNKMSGISLSKVPNLIIEKIPMVILLTISSSLTIIAQRRSVKSLVILPFVTRILNAIASYVIYLFKIIYFFKLAVFYPYNYSYNPFVVIGCTLFLLIVTIQAVLFAKRYPFLLVGWFWYLGTLIPVIGIVQVGDQSMADRYTYIPLIGIFIMIVWGLWEVLYRWRYGKAFIKISLIVTIIILMNTTNEQISLWKNSESLFNHALTVTKDNDVAYDNLGLVLFNRDDIGGAKKLFKLAIKVNPSDIFGHSNLGKVLFKEKKYDEALSQFHECLNIYPEYGDAYNFIGNIMLSTENYNKAIVNYDKALRIDSSQTEVYYHLGIAYFHKNNYPKAIECFQEAIRRNPYYSEAIRYLNEAKSAQTNLNNLILNIKASIKVDPQNVALHMKLGNIYLQECEYESAITQYQDVLSVQPQYIPAMYRLALIYSEKTEFSIALNILEKIKNIQPNNPEVYYNIACIYAKQNMADESVNWLKQAVEKGFQNWELINKDPDLANIRNNYYVVELLKHH